MVRSPVPMVSVVEESTPSVIPVECIGNMDLPFGVALLDSVAKSSTEPNGTG